MLSNEKVQEALEKVMDPELQRDIVELGMVRDIQIEGACVSLTLALTTLACPLKDKITADARQAISALAGVEQVVIELTEMTDEERARIGSGDQTYSGQAANLNRVRQVIAVMSGKGGVGKSLVSGLLAVALQRQGRKVGILDADITGPSIPKMFFPNGARPGATPTAILPAQSQSGVKVMSINLLLEQEDQAVVWRGPLIAGAIQQFWGDVLWGELDFLIVDLPPGTSDASLTVMQTLPLSGVVLVTSPQDLAGMVVRKAAQMAQHMNKPILGLVENMAYFACPDTGKRYDIFGPSHAEEIALRIGVPFLGRLPIDPEIAKLCDGGKIEDYVSEDFAPIVEQLVKEESLPG